MRLLTVADQSLGALRTNLDDFITVVRTIEDPAIKQAQGKFKLTAALEESRRAVAAIAAARTSAAPETGAAEALRMLDDTRAGADELHSQIAAMLNGGDGTTKFHPLVIQTRSEQIRGMNSAASDALRSVEGSADVAESGVFTQIAAETKPVKPASITDQHIDDVTSEAAGLAAATGQMPKLEEVGVDMIAAARAGKYDNLVGREQEVDQILTILQRKRKANPILLGDPGVGKTQLVEGLAVRVAKGEVPEAMRDLKIYSLDAATLKAAAGAERGAMEKLVKEIVDEV